MDNAGSLACTCLSGYSGKQCNFTTSSCSKMCQNGGTCLITYSNNEGYICNCPIQYNGKNCQSNQLLYLNVIYEIVLNNIFFKANMSHV